MGIITTHTCDRCEHSQPTDEQMWHIGICIVSHHEKYSQKSFETIARQKQYWCRSCIEKFGLLPPTKLKTPPPPLATIEDLIRELIGEIVADTIAQSR